MALWGKNDADANTKPKFVSQDSNVTRDGANTYVGSAASVTVYGVDATESAVAGGDVPHTGWVKVTRGEGGRAGRTQFEVLVAGGMDGEVALGGDDAQFPNV